MWESSYTKCRRAARPGRARGARPCSPRGPIARSKSTGAPSEAMRESARTPTRSVLNRSRCWR